MLFFHNQSLPDVTIGIIIIRHVETSYFEEEMYDAY